MCHGIGEIFQKLSAAAGILHGKSFRGSEWMRCEHARRAHNLLSPGYSELVGKSGVGVSLLVPIEPKVPINSHYNTFCCAPFSVLNRAISIMHCLDLSEAR